MSDMVPVFPEELQPVLSVPWDVFLQVVCLTTPCQFTFLLRYRINAVTAFRLPMHQERLAKEGRLNIAAERCHDFASKFKDLMKSP